MQGNSTNQTSHNCSVGTVVCLAVAINSFQNSGAGCRSVATGDILSSFNLYPHSVAHHCALHAIVGLGGSHVDYGTWLRLVLVAVSAVAHMTCWVKLCGGNAAPKGYRSCHQVYRCTSRPVRFPQQYEYLLVWRAGPETHQLSFGKHSI